MKIPLEIVLASIRNIKLGLFHVYACTYADFFFFLTCAFQDHSSSMTLYAKCALGLDCYELSEERFSPSLPL